MELKCCVQCFQDTAIQTYIKENNEVSTCDYCKSQKVYCASVDSVGKFIRKGLKREFEPVDEGTGSMYDSETESYIDEGESVDTILKDFLEIFSDKLNSDQADSLCCDLITESGPSEQDKQDGENDWIADQNLVVKDSLYGSEVTSEYYNWETFKYICKFYNRYFDLGGQISTREHILSSLDNIFNKMQVQLPSNTTLFRGRHYELQDGKNLKDIDLLKEISPPPRDNSKNSRMSPAGISYTYLGSRIKTCLYEIRFNKSDKILIGKFTTKKELKILDLTQEPKFPATSCFSPEYDNCEKWLGDFVEEFKDEISMPISDNDKSLEYVPTQILAEYIRKKQFDGIKFRSSLYPKGVNYVLFCSINPCKINEYNTSLLGIDVKMPSFTEWLNLARGLYINFETKQLDKIKFDGKTAKCHAAEKLRKS